MIRPKRGNLNFRSKFELRTWFFLNCFFLQENKTKRKKWWRELEIEIEIEQIELWNIREFSNFRWLSFLAQIWLFCLFDKIFFLPISLCNARSKTTYIFFNIALLRYIIYGRSPRIPFFLYEKIPNKFQIIPLFVWMLSYKLQKWFSPRLLIRFATATESYRNWIFDHLHNRFLHKKISIIERKSSFIVRPLFRFWLIMTFCESRKSVSKLLSSQTYTLGQKILAFVALPTLLVLVQGKIALIWYQNWSLFLYNAATKIIMFTYQHCVVMRYWFDPKPNNYTRTDNIEQHFV